MQFESKTKKEIFEFIKFTNSFDMRTFHGVRLEIQMEFTNRTYLNKCHCKIVLNHRFNLTCYRIF